MYKKKYFQFILLLMCMGFWTCQNQEGTKATPSPAPKTETKAEVPQKKDYQTTVTDKYGGGTKINEGDLQKVNDLTYAIKTINHSSDKDIYTVSMEYPVFEGNSDRGLQNRLNKLIYKYIDQSVRDFKIYAIQNNNSGRNDLLASCKVSKKTANLLRLDFVVDKLHSNKGEDRVRQPYSTYFDMVEALPKPIIKE